MAQPDSIIKKYAANERGPGRAGSDGEGGRGGIGKTGTGAAARGRDRGNSFWPKTCLADGGGLLNRGDMCP